DLRRVFPARAHAYPFLACRFRHLRAVVEADNVDSQHLLRLERVTRDQLLRLVGRSVGQQREPLGHQFVGDTHRLVELALRLLRDTNVVAGTFAHLALAVQAAEDGHGDADLRLLPGIDLELPPNHQVVQLFATAQLDVGADLDAVAALHQRVEAFTQVDFPAGLDPFGEVVALQHSLHGDLTRQTQHVAEGEAAEPLPVVTDLGPRDVDDAADLCQVVAGVGLDLLCRQPLARVVAAAGVADA